MRFALIAAALGLALASPAVAQTPFQLGLVWPAQAFPESWDVNGLRVSALLATNRDVTGLDVSGFANRTLGDQRGLQVGVYNEVSGDLVGAQLGAFIADVDGHVRGAQLGGLVSMAGQADAVQLSALHNRAETLRGLQISLVNWAEDGEGFQLGLLNFNWGARFPILPLFNFGF